MPACNCRRLSAGSLPWGMSSQILSDRFYLKSWIRNPLDTLLRRFMIDAANCMLSDCLLVALTNLHSSWAALDPEGPDFNVTMRHSMLNEGSQVVGCSENWDVFKERDSEYERNDQHLKRVIWTGNGLKTSLTILLLQWHFMILCLGLKQSRSHPVSLYCFFANLTT